MLGGTCIAGLTIPDLRWVRPTIPSNRGLDIADDVEMYDLIRIELGDFKAAGFQPENCLLDIAVAVELLSRPASFDLMILAQKALSDDVWVLDTTSNFIELDYAEKASCLTLVLVEPSEVVWGCSRNAKGHRQIRVAFAFKNHRYDLPVTDYITSDPPFAELAYGTHRESELDIGGQIGYHYDEADEYKLQFTISLGQPLGTRCYKLVAGILSMPQRKLDDQDASKILKRDGIAFLDRRHQGGQLWVLGGAEVGSLLMRYRSNGFFFEYCAEGSRTTGLLPGWFLSSI